MEIRLGAFRLVVSDPDELSFCKLSEALLSARSGSLSIPPTLVSLVLTDLLSSRRPENSFLRIAAGLFFGSNLVPDPLSSVVSFREFSPVCIEVPPRFTEAPTPGIGGVALEVGANVVAIGSSQLNGAPSITFKAVMGSPGAPVFIFVRPKSTIAEVGGRIGYSVISLSIGTEPPWS